MVSTSFGICKKLRAFKIRILEYQIKVATGLHIGFYLELSS